MHGHVQAALRITAHGLDVNPQGSVTLHLLKYGSLWMLLLVVG